MKQMGRVIVFFIVFVIIFTCYGCNDVGVSNVSLTPSSNSTESRDDVSGCKDVVKTNYKLIVDGKVFPTEDVVYMYLEEYYVELPFLAILNRLGATINWENQTTARIELNDRIFILNAERQSLYEEGVPIDWFSPPPGGGIKTYASLLGEEYVIDNHRSVEFIREICSRKITIDYKSLTVVIE